MSGWGIAAAGLAGGANAVGDISKGYIDQDRRLESAQVLADIDTQRQMRLAEYAQKMGRENQTYNTTGAGGAELLAHEKAKDEQAQGIVLAGRKAEAIDPEITAGLAGRAGAVAKATGDVQTEQDIKRAAAMLPLEIKRAYALADASGRASAAHREKAPTLAGKVAEIESAIGRVLTEEEKLGVLGLAKSQATDKVTTIDTVEDINTGRKSERKVESTVPRGAGASEQRIPESTAHAQAQAAITTGGADPAAVNKRLVELGYQPLAGAEPKAKPQPRGIASPVAAADPITTLNDSTLKRIAAIKGHADQAKAQAELERRAGNQPEIDTSGVGFQ